jgi:hypothetical protein
MSSKMVDVEDPHLPTFSSTHRFDLAQTPCGLCVPFLICHV